MEQSYKEKYEQAIERLKQWDREHPCAGYVLSDRDKFIFPELAESEGEKVIKEIIELVMQPTWKTEEEFHRRNVLCAWLENVPVTIDHEKREGFHLGYKAGLERLEMKSAEESLGIDSDTYNKIVDECIFGEQKPEENKGNIGGISANSEWGEDDEAFLDDILCKLEHDLILNKDEKDWLKSLKDRVQPQPKQEWSEEDKDYYDAIIAKLEVTQEDAALTDNQMDFLKSLRPQNKCAYNPYKAVVESIAEMCKHYDKASHSGLRDFYDNVKVKCKDAQEYDKMFPQAQWKPSEEQMQALWLYAKQNNYYGAVLTPLYKYLKKLKEGKV